MTLKFDDNWRCRIHSISDGNEEISTNERYMVMPWKMVTRRGENLTLKEAVDEIFSNQDELTNSMYVTLKFNDNGRCRNHSISDRNEEIGTNERYMVMPWKMVTRCGENLTLKEAADEIFSNQDELTNSTYVTLKFDDNGHCRIHSISDGKEEIGTNERYMVMPWKMVTRRGENLTLKEALEEIEKEGEERRLVFEFETRHRDEILEILGVIDYVDKGYVKERFPEIYKFDPERLGIHFENRLVLEEYSSGHPIKQGYSQLYNFKKLIKAYNGCDSNAVKYVEKVEAFIDKPLDELELKDIRAIMNKVKFPRKLDISVFYQLTGRLPCESLGYDGYYEDFIIHFYNTFVAASIELLGKIVRCLMYYTIFLRRLARNQMLICFNS